MIQGYTQLLSSTDTISLQILQAVPREPSALPVTYASLPASHQGAQKQGRRNGLVVKHSVIRTMTVARVYPRNGTKSLFNLCFSWKCFHLFTFRSLSLYPAYPF